MKSLFKNVLLAAIVTTTAHLAWADAGALTANAWCSANTDLDNGISIYQRYVFNANGTFAMEQYAVNGAKEDFKDEKGEVIVKAGETKKMDSEPGTWEIKPQGLKMGFDAEGGEFTYIEYKIDAAKTEAEKARLTLSSPMAPEMVYTSCK